ncbi:sugar-phosphatase [Liquorilactobacillus mali]|uniref:sugar-phosphatase n=1 Tax=Liquorilactobacillus mali TaxID=1618 RepID=UPI00265374CE|nr:sugar-phosphatase [Liquorilactobacillus mali]MDN7146323.1 sugar-phosphatase [Liquorilactobacillus mali]
MISIKLVAIDIDGTLVNSQKELTKKVKETITQAKERNIKVVICTGRPISGVRKLLKELELDNQDEQYVVCFGGAVVQTTAGKIISSQPITYQNYLDLEKLARKLNLHFHAISEDRIYTANKDIGYYTVYESNLVSLGISYRTPDEMSNINLIKAMFIDEQAILDKAISNWGPFSKMENELVFTKSAPFYLEANAKGVNKGNALSKLGAVLGITPDEIMAIGDEQNDLSMIKFAGLGVAMKNAIPQVKEAASVTTDDNDHDGVAKAIQKYVL